MRNSQLKPGDKIRLTNDFQMEIITVEALGDVSIKGTNNNYYWNNDHDTTWGGSFKHRAWDVELIKEENMNEVKEEKITGYRDLKPGDKLRITREIEVRSVNSYDGIRTKDGRTYRIDGCDFGLPGFNVVRLVPVKKSPEHYPPQADDVWELNGDTFHIHMDIGGNSKAFASSGYCCTLDYLDNKDAKLVYRKGNALRS